MIDIVDPVFQTITTPCHMYYQTVKIFVTSCENVDCNYCQKKKKKKGYVCFCNVSNLQTLWSHKKGILLFTSLIEIYIGKTNYKDDFNSENLNYMKIRRF